MVVIEGEPVCQERPRFVSRGGKSWAYDPTEKAKKALGMCLLAQRTGILERNLWLDIEFFIGKTRKRIDLDNLIKAFCDAGNGVLYKDDSQIIRITAGLHRDADKPRTAFKLVLL